MSILDKIISTDKSVLIYINNLGSPHWDGFWLNITQSYNWIPLFMLMLLLIFKVYGLKKGLVVLCIADGLIAFTDQFVNLMKYSFERIRPNDDPSMKDLMRVLTQPHSFSFVSGHAANSMANTTFIYLLLKKHVKYAWLFFIWPLFFSYSRIYLGVHYPIDILTGTLLGIFLGFVSYKISLLILARVKLKDELTSSALTDTPED